MLLLPGFHVVASELAFAIAVNNLAVGRRAYLAALAARSLDPGLRRIVRAPGERRDVVNRDGAVVLLWPIEPVRKLVINVDHVKLRRRLIEDRRPASPAVLRNIGAAVVAFDENFRIVGIDPDRVIVAVWRSDGAERFAAVGRMMKAKLSHPDVVFVPGVDEHFVEIERPGAQARIGVDQLPGRAAIV